MISTVIFDLDGLLADTERLHFQAYREVLERYGVTVSRAVYAEHWIRSGKGIADYLHEKRLALDVEEVRREKAVRYTELVETVVAPMPGARAVLERLSGHKTLALASSAYQGAVQAVLHRLGFREFFVLVATNADVTRLKPAPDLFLYVARELNVAPAECLVLEDAEKGIVAAWAAGMRSIAVPNEFTCANDFSKADLVLTSLDEITVDLVDTRFR